MMCVLSKWFSVLALMSDKVCKLAAVFVEAGPHSNSHSPGRKGELLATLLFTGSVSHMIDDLELVS